MQGYILSFNRVKDEDLIVSILTSQKLLTLYRFYGARHSTINMGYKIDFELEVGDKGHIDRLRNIHHLGFTWMADINKMLIWQQVVKLFFNHLRENEILEPFYYELFEEMAQKWAFQNPKRIAIESYVKLLAFEGRLHTQMECFLCASPINEDPSLVRAFLPTHRRCSFAKTVSKEKLLKFFKSKQSFMLDDNELETYYELMLEGL